MDNLKMNQEDQSKNTRSEFNEYHYKFRQKLGMIFGPIVFLVMLLLPSPEGLSIADWRTTATAVMMAILWMTEAIPIPVTAILPLVLFPVLGVGTIKEVAAPYANPLIYLFMGGFIIALGMQHWGVHKRIALNIIRLIGTHSRSIVQGFMVSAAVLSMWVSNTAATLMMLPIGFSVIELVEKSNDFSEDSRDRKNFTIALLLGIAFASSIGGIGTLIGTLPNALMAGFMKETYGYEVGFAQWMLIGVPFVLIGLPVCFFILTRIAFLFKMSNLPGGEKVIQSELKKLEPITKPEKIVAFVFVLVAFLWIVRPLLSKMIPELSDTGIAVFGALLLFVLPVDLSRGVFLLNWKEAEKLPWGVLILFGGGLTLASSIHQTGLDTWIGNGLSGTSHWPMVFIIFIITATISFLTELNSNTATATTFLPVVASVAVVIGQNPLLFVVPGVIAASCAFMLPVATPPNAIVYGSGRLTIPQMIRVGVILDIFLVFLINLFSYTVIHWVFGIQLGILPDWISAL